MAAGNAPDSVPSGGDARPSSSPSSGIQASILPPFASEASSFLPAMTYSDMASSPLLYVSCISSFFLAHALLVCLLRLSRAKSPLLATCAFPRHGVNRIISTLHACVVINWALLILLEDSTAHRPSLPVPPSSSASARCLFHFGRPVTDYERPMLLFSLSYFLYDTLYELASWDLSSVLHHVTSLVGLVNVLVVDRAGTDLVTALLVAEVSTPALHLRYFLVQYAKRAEALAKTYSVGEPDAETTPREQTKHGDAATERSCRHRGAETATETTGESETGRRGPERAANESAKGTDGSRVAPGLPGQETGSRPGNDCVPVDKTSPQAVAQALGKHDFRGPLDAVERAFFIIFLFGRGVAAPCLVYACVTCGSTPVLVRIGSVGILVVSVFWMILLFRGLLKRLNKAAGASAGVAPWKPEPRKREYSVRPSEEVGECRRQVGEES